MGGSWRRGAPVIGDIDLLVITEAGTLTPDLMDPGVLRPRCVTWQRHGSRIANGYMHLDDGPLNVDCWSAKPESRGVMLAFFTGPMRLNLQQRARAKKLGLVSSQNGLADRETGKQLADGTAESIYAFCDGPGSPPRTGSDTLSDPRAASWLLLLVSSGT